MTEERNLLVGQKNPREEQSSEHLSQEKRHSEDKKSFNQRKFFFLI